MKPSVGILAYGSLIANPGKEISSATVELKGGITTPFKVEFARSSAKREGAPTLVPVADHGAQVRAQLFVLNASKVEAADRLYRREVNEVGSEKRYSVPKVFGLNTVVVKCLDHFEGVDAVLYTEISPNIKSLTAKKLAELAIQSARKLKDGRDGITYLINAKENGIETLLSPEYEEEIKKQTQASNLHDALLKIRKAHG